MSDFHYKRIIIVVNKGKPLVTNKTQRVAGPTDRRFHNFSDVKYVSNVSFHK